MSFKSNNFHFLLCTILCLLCLSCAKETSQEGALVETQNTSGWISNLGLDTNTRAKLSMNNSNNYEIVGKDYILKVDAEGNVTEEIQGIFPAPPEGLFEKKLIFDDKVYGFISDSSSDLIADQNIELKIYDLNGALEQSTVLKANHVLRDVVIEEDKMTLLTWDWDDPTAQGARTNIFQVDNSGQLLFTSDLSSIPNVTGRVFHFMKLEDGNFIFEYDKTLYKVDSNFELISSFYLDYLNIHFTEGADGNIYVGGSPTNTTNGITKFDKDLNKLNEITFNNEITSDPIHPSLTTYWFSSLIVHGDHLYTQEPAVEWAHELRIQCYDLELNKVDELILEGSGPLSDLLINELGSVSFLYGVPDYTPDGYPNPDSPSEARLFKLAVDCQLPELIVEN